MIQKLSDETLLIKQFDQLSRSSESSKDKITLSSSFQFSFEMNNLTPDSRIAAMQLCVSDIIIQKAPEVFYLILAFHANKVMITSNLLKDKRSTFFFRQTLSCFEPTKLHNLFLILQFAFSFCFLQSE